MLTGSKALFVRCPSSPPRKAGNATRGTTPRAAPQKRAEEGFWAGIGLTRTPVTQGLHTSKRAPLALPCSQLRSSAELGAIAPAPEVLPLPEADAGGPLWQGSYGACSVRKLASGRDGRRQGESLPKRPRLPALVGERPCAAQRRAPLATASYGRQVFSLLPRAEPGNPEAAAGRV